MFEYLARSVRDPTLSEREKRRRVNNYCFWNRETVFIALRGDGPTERAFRSRFRHMLVGCFLAIALCAALIGVAYALIGDVEFEDFTPLQTVYFWSCVGPMCALAAVSLGLAFGTVGLRRKYFYKLLLEAEAEPLPPDFSTDVRYLDLPANYRDAVFSRDLETRVVVCESRPGLFHLRCQRLTRDPDDDLPYWTDLAGASFADSLVDTHRLALDLLGEGAPTADEPTVEEQPPTEATPPDTPPDERAALQGMSKEELWQLFPIQLREPSPAYAAQYERMRETLVDLLGPLVLRLSHVGSTAVPNLVAKPIVDLLLEVSSPAELAKAAALLEGAGWIVMSRSESPLRCSFNRGYTVRGFAEEVFHLHLRLAGDCDELYFRDYLRDHPEARAAYAALKKSLLPRFEHDRDGYTEAKTDFVRRTTDLAKQAYPCRY